MMGTAKKIIYLAVTGLAAGLTVDSISMLNIGPVRWLPDVLMLYILVVGLWHIARGDRERGFAFQVAGYATMAFTLCFVFYFGSLHSVLSLGGLPVLSAAFLLQVANGLFGLHGSVSGDWKTVTRTTIWGAAFFIVTWILLPVQTSCR